MQIDIEGSTGFRRAVAAIKKRKPKVSFPAAAGETVVGALECRVAKESFHTETRSSGVGKRRRVRSPGRWRDGALHQ